MKWGYRLSPPSYALAQLDRDEEGTWWLTDIHVPNTTGERGKGRGSALLRMVLGDADRERVPVFLVVVAGDGLDNAALCAWYERYGFTLEPNGLIYRRAPGTPIRPRLRTTETPIGGKTT